MGNVSSYISGQTLHPGGGYVVKDGFVDAVWGTKGCIKKGACMVKKTLF